MKKDFDPIGAALIDYFAGKTQAMIEVRSDLASDDSMQVKYLFRNYTDWPVLEKLAIKECKGKIMEAGAGAGSHALFLQQKGFDITALDISPGAVSVMEKRGIKKTICGDIFRWKRREFDTLLMLMNGIGLVGTISNLKSFLKHAFKDILKPGGELIFDSSNLIYLFEDDENEFTVNNKRKYYGEVKYWMIYKGKKGPKFNWLFVDFFTLEKICDSMGFKAELLKRNDHFAYLAKISQE